MRRVPCTCSVDGGIVVFLLVYLQFRSSIRMAIRLPPLLGSGVAPFAPRVGGNWQACPCRCLRLCLTGHGACSHWSRARKLHSFAGHLGSISVWIVTSAREPVRRRGLVRSEMGLSFQHKCRVCSPLSRIVHINERLHKSTHTSNTISRCLVISLLLFIKMLFRSGTCLNSCP